MTDRDLQQKRITAALIDIAKSEKDPQLKKTAVSHLANMHSKEATAFLLEILNK